MAGKKNHKVFVKAAIVAVLSLGTVNVASSAIVTSFSDDFEGESLSLVHTFADWNVVNGSVDTVGPGHFAIDCQGSNVCVDMDGHTNDAGDLVTADSFAVGTYQLSFDISGSQRSGLDSEIDSITVLFGDLNEEFTLAFDAPWQTVTRTVNVTSIDNLTFSHAGGDLVGIILDNVSVTVVPVPAAVWLFGSALAGLGWIRRKRTI